MFLDSVLIVRINRPLISSVSAPAAKDDECLDRFRKSRLAIPYLVRA